MPFACCKNTHINIYILYYLSFLNPYFYNTCYVIKLILYIILRFRLFNSKGDSDMDVLTIEHLTKKIGNKTILDDVSFKLKRGQIVGLVGANGAGKTTLMKVILGYSSFQSGNFNVINSKDSKSNIGALIENPGIYPFMSGYENLKLLNESKNTQDIDKIVSQLHMDEYIHKKAKTYSLGMKQKLGIAIAFLNEPQFIILDEPMNGLDPKAV